MSRLAQARGKGRAGLDDLFPDQTPMTVAPWPRAGRRRGETNPMPHIEEALRNGAQPTEVDPTDPRLHSSQPSITRSAVSHYLDSSDLYADQHKAGNQTPVVWRTRNGAGEETMVLMSGHHRATASALAGRQFQALVVNDPAMSPA